MFLMDQVQKVSPDNSYKASLHALSSSLERQTDVSGSTSREGKVRRNLNIDNSTQQMADSPFFFTTFEKVLNFVTKVL